MKVLKPTRLSCLTRPYRHLNEDRLAITVYAMVDFSSGFSLEPEQRLWGIFNEESVQHFGAEALDFGIPKPRPEIILNAYGFGAYAIDGRTAVSVSVNNVRKDLWITGDRYWLDGRPSRPQPFERIAISWRNTYGGPGFESNPQGKGFQISEVQGMRVRFLPNVEDPAHPVVREGRHVPPAGYAAIPIESPGRNRMLGTYDEHWRVHEFPGFARDIDWEYFNQSPPWQRLNRLEAGDRITFTHMHPDKDELTTHVPPLRTRAFIKRETVAAENDRFLEEIALRLTTYWAYPHLEKAILIFQGAVPVDEYDASDISHILYAAEHCDTPRAPGHYEDVFRKRLHPEKGGFHALQDKQLVDARFLLPTPQDEIELSPLLRNKLRKQERELEQQLHHRPDGATISEETAAELAQGRAWLEKSRHGKVRMDDIIDEMLASPPPREALKAARKKLKKQGLGAAPLETDTFTPEMKERHKRVLQEQRESLLAKLCEDAQRKLATDAGAGSKAQAAASDAAQGQLRQLRLEQLGQFEEMLAKAPLTKPATRDYAGKPKRLHRIFGLDQRDTEPLPEGCDGHELYGFTASGISYAGRDFSMLTIRNGQLSDCDLSRSRSVGCDFDDVTFKGCDFSSADWEQAHFTRCRFIDCRLPGVLTNKARFEDCRFIQCSLSDWIHFRITLKDCVFAHCRLTGFAFMRSRLTQLVFEDCLFTRMAFVKGKAAGLRMKACQIESLALIDLGTVTALSLLQCRASKLYVTPETVLEELEISYSTIAASGFRRVVFKACRVSASDLSSCDFSEASMRGASLADSFFNQCLLIRTDLSESSVTNSDFGDAQAKAADLNGAHLRHVSFFGADLAMVRADGDTVQQDMLMERANVYPLRA